MTFYAFGHLSTRAQLLHVMLGGTYLTQRSKNSAWIKLYYLPDGGRGFFAEVGFDKAQDCFAVLHSFNGSRPLENYTHSVRLPVA